MQDIKFPHITIQGHLNRTLHRLWGILLQKERRCNVIIEKKEERENQNK
jgi:hypothetical protein